MKNAQTHACYYRVYGFTIRSSYELPYPEIEPVDDADVMISDGLVPNTLGDDAYKYGIWQGKPGRFLLVEGTIGRILVQDGSKITVQCGKDVDPRWVSVYINGSALAALLQQRGLLPLHASAVHVDGGAVLFAGASGVGKSTLAAMLHDRGYSLLSEDVSAIRLDANNVPLLEPAAGHLRLWRDVTEKLDYETADKQMAAHNFQKFEFPVAPTLNNAVPITKIYFLEPDSNEDICLSDPDRGEAFRLVRRRSYRGRFHLGQGLQQQHFNLVNAIRAAVPVRCVSRPTEGGVITDLTDVIERDMNTGATLSNGQI